MHLTIIKRILSCVIVLVLASCSKYDDVNSRLNLLETEVTSIKSLVEKLNNAYNEGKIICKVQEEKDNNNRIVGWIIIFSDGSIINIHNGTDGKDGADGDSFFEKVEIEGGYVLFTLTDGTVLKLKLSPEERPQILSMSFYAKDNAEKLVHDINCVVENDSTITCWIPHLLTNKQLVPHITYKGDNVVVNSQVIKSDATIVDFTKPLALSVSLGALITNYTVYVYSFTGLPTCWIDTEERKEISSKEEYVNAHFRLVEDIITRSAGDVVEGDLQIKGRGNSTWSLYPQKPYRLKFTEKVSLLGEQPDKSWVLLANYYDKSMLANHLAFYLGRMSNLDWTPSDHFVELFLNGRYQGTYQLTEKIKIAKHRVNVGNDGLLMEIDGYATKEADARFFYTQRLSYPVNIKDPDVEYGDEIFEYARNYVRGAEDVLYGESFKDPDIGWRKYMDETSFVDYYLISEIVKNCDAMWWNAWMHLKSGGGAN